MAQRYKFSIESKSFPLDISGEPWAVVLLVPDNRQCEGLDSGISGIDSHVFFYGLCLTVAIIFS